MVRRFLPLFVTVLFIFLAIDIAQGLTNAPPRPSTKLIAVDLASGDALDLFYGTGMPAYARLTGYGGDHLLVGATMDGLNELSTLGLPFQIVDDDMSGGNYYLVYPLPDRPVPHWQEYGRLLLDDGVQVLMQMDSFEADRLAESGGNLQKLFLDPIVLRAPEVGDRFPEVIEPDPEIQAMMDQVLSSTVNLYDGDLSGEWPVTVRGGQPYTILTRYTNSGEPIQKATQFVGDHMANLSLGVEYHFWSASPAPNVIGQITGETNPEQIFMITAHIDDLPSIGRAPGADDNASGSTAVMIAAEILSQYRWGCTLRFAFFTGEEQGLLGSRAYANRASGNGENIAGVLNLDMIGWNTQGSSRDIDLHVNSFQGSIAIAQQFVNVIHTYNVDLIPQIVENGSGASDHASFWSNGYDAILGIEDFGDFNPNWHKIEDLLENLDIDYFTEFVRASIGAYAHMSNCMVPTGSLEGTVSDVDDGTPIAGAEVFMEYASAWEATTSTDEDGYYTYPLGMGTYTVTVSADGYESASVGGVDILANSVTTQDFDLSQETTLDFYYPLLQWVVGDP